MSDLTLNMSCLEEDSMTVSLDFNIEQGSPDGFELWINDSLYGVLAYADLPYETMPLFVDCSQDYQFRVEDGMIPPATWSWQWSLLAAR